VEAVGFDVNLLLEGSPFAIWQIVPLEESASLVYYPIICVCYFAVGVRGDTKVITAKLLKLFQRV